MTGKRKVKASLTNITSIATALALAIILWLVVKVVITPPPYEYKNLVYAPNIQVCPGGRIEYEVDIHINKTPITVIKSENFFSENPEIPNNFFFDTYDGREIFPWDSLVPKVLHIKNFVYIPYTSSKGLKVQPGKFRYIANLDSEGIKDTASITIPFEIPSRCF